MRARRCLPPVLASLLALVAWAAAAQPVGLSGVMGNRALLIVGGAPPRAVAPGETYQGVKVVSAAGDSATVEIDGQRHVLRVGEAPASVGGPPRPAGGRKIVLQAGSGGHFITSGSINGRPAQFMVDTGATTVAMAVSDAERLGVAYRQGQPIAVSTANGVIQAWRVKLGRVRVGDVEVFDVDASVVPMAMPYLLLGNSFLTRFQMRRENDQLTLEKKF